MQNEWNEVGNVFLPGLEVLFLVRSGLTSAPQPNQSHLLFTQILRTVLEYTLELINFGRNRTILRPNRTRKLQKAALVNCPSFKFFQKKIAKSCSAHVKGPNPKQHFEWRIWNWATIPMYQVFSIKITFFNWKSLKSCWHDEDMFEHGFLQNLFHKV